jgi:membrane-associated phospholipid phosphatase
VFRQREDLEERLLRLARTRGHSPAAERVVASFSRLGEHGAVWLAIGLAGGIAQRGRRGEWRRARRTVGAAYVTNTALKFAVGRRRPNLPDLPPLTGTPTGLSFPSAHAATAFAGALAYSRLGIPKGPLYGLASALAYSRLYLGVHYPSDILAGALLGTALAAGLTGPSPAPSDPARGEGS